MDDCLFCKIIKGEIPSKKVYEDDYVYVKLYGACSHCGYQDYTLNNGILELIQEKVPNVIGIINVEI